jgi:uncharacterized protein YqeY
MIEKEIRAKIIQAMRDKDEVSKNILRLVIGEMERSNKDQSIDDEWISIIRKIIKNLNSSIEAAQSTRIDLVVGLKLEKEILEQFLPNTMTKEAIRLFIEQKGIINPSLGENKCMGLVVKALKASEMEFNNIDVKEVISEMIEQSGK